MNPMKLTLVAALDDPVIARELARKCLVMITSFSKVVTFGKEHGCMSDLQLLRANVINHNISLAIITKYPDYSFNPYFNIEEFTSAKKIKPIVKMIDSEFLYSTKLGDRQNFP